MPDPVEIATALAESVLLPAAEEIDAAPVVPVWCLDRLAEAGLYGLFGPRDAFGFDADAVTAGRVVEALGGASLAVTFVWIQHHSVVRAISAARPALRDEWLDDLCRGARRAGIAYAALRRPGPPSAVARAARGSALGSPDESDRWVLEGFAPWVTGWGLVDVVLVGARCGEEVVWMLIDAEPAPTCTVTPVSLAAVNASSTVRLDWHDHVVPGSRVVGTEPFEEWKERDAHGRQLNGYLAIGVAARCAALVGPSPLDDEMAAARQALDTATATSVVAARADASVLAVRAAAALVAAGGGRSVEAGQPASRLTREAMFLLVFGQTADIRAAQLSALGAALGPGR